MYLALNGDWFREYVRNAFEKVSDCYIAKVVESGEIEGLKDPTIVVSEEDEHREEM